MNLKLTFISLFISLIVTPMYLRAQTVTTIASGEYYTAVAHDASGNLYTTRYDGGSDRYQVVKYVNGTGTPQVIAGGLSYSSNGYPWGLVVASNGDLYIASNADNTLLKLPYNSGTGSYGSPQTIASGNYYAALAIDAADNLYTTEYAAASSDYAIVKYPAGSSTGTQLYHGLLTGPGYQYPAGLAISANGDIFAVDGFNSGDGQFGAVYRFTAASGYTTRTTITSGSYPTSLALDPQGNLYVSEYDGSKFILNRYANGSGTPVKVTDLDPGSDFYPWGIVALNSTNIYFASGGDGLGGSLKHLLDDPQTPASNISFTNVTGSSATINWTNGNGVRRTVFMMAGSSGAAAPVDGTDYTANTIFGSGSEIGASGWYTVYSGSGTTVDVTGLSATTQYRVMVVEDNGNSYYQTATATGNPANITTTVLPVTFGTVSAVLENGVLTVKWSTESETNNDHFIVEASVDGKHFEPLGTVASQAVNGNSDTQLDYRFEKAADLTGLAILPFVIALLGFPASRRRRYELAGLVLLAAAVSVISCTKNNTDIKGIEKIFVRIAQVDKDGTTKYSKVVAAVQK